MSDESVSPPRSRLPMLRQWYAKMLYVIAGFAIWYFAAGLVPSDEARGILRAVLVFLLFALAARVFRTEDEDNAPRPLWRMTGRPRAGWVLGIIAGLGAIWLLVAAIGTQFAPRSAHVTAANANLPVFAITAVALAALAVLYLTSSVRLRALAASHAAARRDED